ncbi:hypothetical protein KVR01_010968 [Diaporthe batatas]|uniref:uncharacterized protein n=1 Tax=Diaporthe batatas TaxID=748121 RepID=UPI001D040186|nr:uncharacterized protein KVR01_010968 [Diaporthe batatas]KAG8159307.1 hypothetical protein KVR01_010968 [Diaporthe batatas]
MAPAAAVKLSARVTRPASTQDMTRKRACTSKVRTGCITCKERHVKCDEAKPACLRCAQAGHVCRGYNPLRSQQRPPRPEPVTRRLLPRQHPGQPAALAITVGRSLAPVRLHGDDVLYFDFFRSHAVADLSGYLPSSFWSHTVLCHSLTDPCTRHAILALGAASYPLVPPGHAHARLSFHGSAAVGHHTRALALFRAMIADGVDGPPSRSSRSVFIVTPLLVAFAMLQGDNHAADALLSGLSLLGRHIRRASKAPVVNQEMESLTCLMLQVYMLCGHNPLYQSQKGNVLAMPSNMFLDSSPPPDAGERPVTASSLEPILAVWASFTSRCLVWLRHTDYTKHSIAPGIYARACAEQADLLARLLRWQQFIYGLRPAPDLDQAYMRGLKLIRLQYETIFVWASEGLDRTRMGFDHHTARFESLVQSCAEILGLGLAEGGDDTNDQRTTGHYSPAPYTGYTFEGFGVVSVLGFVVTRCRLGPIRRRAMSILARIWWRENGWDTVATYRGAKALMELEEQGGIPGADGELYIPAESRYYWGDARWEHALPASQRLICTFAQRRPDELGDVCGVPVVIGLSSPRPKQ